MQKDFRAVTINLDRDIYDLLESLKSSKQPSMSSIIRNILLNYFNSEKEQEPIVISGEPLRKEKPDPYAIRVALRAKKMGRDYDKSLEPFLNG